jgi:MFS family permease
MSPADSVLRHPGFRAYLATFVLTMMADNVEHVLTYWVIFEKFKSEGLAYFAVVSHWLPFLLLSVFVGALNDRFDSRRLIQAGGALFALVSLGWGVLFLTDTLQMWHAMVLLVLHGCAGVLWMTSSQVLLYDIVGPERLPHAVRLSASFRYLGTLVGPGVGALLMQTVGTTYGMFLNAGFYLPLLVWLVGAPYGKSFRAAVATGPKRAIRGLADILGTIKDVRGIPVLVSMMLLAGAASFFVGNSYQAQMPNFANDLLGQHDPGLAYGMLLAADAAGAIVAAIWLQMKGGFKELKPTLALGLSIAWGLSLAAFAQSSLYATALGMLFLAGFFELSFSSTAQALVQMNAPLAIRGRVLGLFSMASSGLRTFSGVVGSLMGLLAFQLTGNARSAHASLAIASLCFVGAVSGLLLTAKASQRRSARAGRP